MILSGDWKYISHSPNGQQPLLGYVRKFFSGYTRILMWSSTAESSSTQWSITMLQFFLFNFHALWVNFYLLSMLLWEKVPYGGSTQWRFYLLYLTLSDTRKRVVKTRSREREGGTLDTKVPEVRSSSQRQQARYKDWSWRIQAKARVEDFWPPKIEKLKAETGDIKSWDLE